MRAIKFRAWDKRRNRWIDPTKFDFPTNGLLMVRGMGTNLYELSQFTGLKDKNGKDIYEGDILLAHEYKKSEPIGRRKRWVVEWDPHYMNGWSRRNNDEYLPLMSAIEEDEEVIGNIYENAEVLK